MTTSIMIIMRLTCSENAVEPDKDVLSVERKRTFPSPAGCFSL
jgi:hypothetical protein